MTALELRKKGLILESDLNRLRLRAELEQLREVASPAAWLREAGHKAEPWVWRLVPLAGMLLARVLRRRAPEPGAGGRGFIGRALAVAPVFVRLWRAFATMSKGSK